MRHGETPGHGIIDSRRLEWYLSPESSRLPRSDTMAVSVDVPPFTFEESMAKTSSQTSTSKVALPRASDRTPQYFSADNYWDLGKFLVEKIIPRGPEAGTFCRTDPQASCGDPRLQAPLPHAQTVPDVLQLLPQTLKRSHFPSILLLSLQPKWMRTSDATTTKNGHQQQVDDIRSAEEDPGSRSRVAKTKRPVLALISRRGMSGRLMPGSSIRQTGIQGQASRSGCGKRPFLLHQSGSCCYGPQWREAGRPAMSSSRCRTSPTGESPYVRR